MTQRGKVVLTLLILGALGVGSFLWLRKMQPGATSQRLSSVSAVPSGTDPAGARSEPASSSSGAVVPTAAPAPPKPTRTAPSQLEAGPAEPVEIGIAYGTEKKRWLEWAVTEFAQTPAGRNVTINLIPLGSIEAAQAIVGGDHRIQVWSPASSVYRDNFVQEFELKHNLRPIEKEEVLALTPMIFVTWKDRSEQFQQKLGPLTFKTLATALKAKGGWNEIAGKPEWGFFKFAHTHPNQSNSGLLTLLLMAYDYHDKDRRLTLQDVLDTKFQAWLIDLETAVVDLPNSTGNLMRDMVLKGPSSFDVVMVYESVAIDFLKNAEGRWGQLSITYPAKNLWSDNPFYILNVPWSDKPQRRAAETFLAFLMSEAAQKVALTHGFRPGNPSVSILFPESPFTKYQAYGLKVDLPSVCEPPPPEVIHNLLVGWNNNVRRR